MNAPFALTFLGVRGSFPVPGPATRETGGNTASLLLAAAGETIILDAGTGIIAAGRLLRRGRRSARPIHIFLSHLHSDHIMGLPFFSPMYDSRAEIVLHYPEEEGRGGRAALEALFLPPYSPITLQGIKARLRFAPLRRGAGSLTLPGAVVVAYMRHESHPRQGVLIYRVGALGRRLVYATDVETPDGFSRQVRRFVHGADLLVHDSQYLEADYAGRPAPQPVPPRKGYGHSTVAMAARNAAECQVKRLFLFHYDPSYSDRQLRQMLARGRVLFPRTFLSQEGKSIRLRS